MMLLSNNLFEARKTNTAASAAKKALIILTLNAIDPNGSILKIFPLMQYKGYPGG